MSAQNKPVPRAMSSFWRSAPGELDSYQTTPSPPQTADIVVVGAGYSGAAVVTHLLRHPNYQATKPSILLLEARELCSGATGRNGGHLKPDYYALASQLAQKYGVKAAAEVADFEAANLAAVTDFIREEQVDCDFVVTRGIDVHFSEKQQQKWKQAYNDLVMAGVESTKSAFCPPEQYAEELSGVKGAKGMFSYTAGHVWPYKLIYHMIKDAIKKGVNVQTHTEVNGLEKAQDGSWDIQSSRGRVSAKQVILATNAYTAGLLPEYRNKIIPYRGVVAHIKTPKRAPLLQNTYSLRFSDWDFDYLIPRPDGSIVVGGARRAYLKDKEAWYGNTDDSVVLESTREYFDGYMQRHFHGWEDSEAYVADHWTGIMGYSSDRLPRVGPVPNRPGIYVMAGFTGHGMPQVFLCAKGLVEMILDKIPFSSTTLPSLFQETEGRLNSGENFMEDIYTTVVRHAKL